jgi:glutathione-regulated potassium-efflux system ancillary protein KefG
MINTDDLCDAQGVASLVGLSHANSVHTYLRRYADMPRPVIDLGPGRSRLWLRPEIEAWLTARSHAVESVGPSVGPVGRSGRSAGPVGRSGQSAGPVGCSAEPAGRPAEPVVVP